MEQTPKNCIRIDEDIQPLGIYKIASILPTLTKINHQPQQSTSLFRSFLSSSSSQKYSQQPLPQNPPLSNPMTIDQFPKFSEDVLYHPTKEEEQITSENISIFKEVEKEEEIDEWRIDAIKEMLEKEYGENILKEDFTKNQQVGVLTIMKFARKNKSNDIDLQTALLKSNSYLKIIRDNLYTELMQQTEVLLNSLSTVNSLEERYSLIANKLIEINNIFNQMKKSFAITNTNSSQSFVRYRNLCSIQEVLDKLRNCYNWYETANELIKEDELIKAYELIQKTMIELSKLHDIQAAQQLLVKVRETRTKIVEIIIKKKYIISEIFNSIDLNINILYDFHEDHWMNEFEEERKKFSEIITCFETIENLDHLIEFFKSTVYTMIIQIPYHTFPEYQSNMFGELSINIKQNKQFVAKIKELPFTIFRNYMKNVTNKIARLSSVIVIFQMILEIDLEQNKNVPKQLLEKLQTVMQTIRKSIRKILIELVEIGNYERSTIEEIERHHQIIEKFIHQLHIIYKKKFQSLETVHDIYLQMFFTSLHKNNVSKVKQLTEFDDFSMIEVENEPFEIIKMIVNQIIVPPLSCSLGQKNEQGTSKIISINNETYFMTNTLNILLITLEKYREVAMKFPQLAERVVTSARELLELFTKCTRKSLLEKEIIAKQIVKRISATMFTVAHQTLLVLSIITPYIHRYLSPNLVISGRILDGVEEMMKKQCVDIRNQLITIFRTRISYYLQTLEQSKTIVEQPEQPQQNQKHQKRNTFLKKSHQQANQTQPNQQQQNQKKISPNDLKDLLNKIIKEIVGLNALLKSNLRAIDYKYCLFEQSKQLNKLREEYDKRALTNEELKAQLSSDLHQISMALREGNKQQVVETEKAPTPSLMSKFMIAEDDDEDEEEDEIVENGVTPKIEEQGNEEEEDEDEDGEEISIFKKK